MELFTQYYYVTCTDSLSNFKTLIIITLQNLKGYSNLVGDHLTFNGIGMQIMYIHIEERLHNYTLCYRFP